MENFTSTNGQFYWWFGVVEDRNDPLRMGRCRVRILGYHVDDTEILPTEDLPWAMPVMPANSASSSGVGWSPTGAVEGSWVVGFFADGPSMQHPMFWGTVGAVPGGLAGTGCSDGEPGSGEPGSPESSNGDFVEPTGNAKTLESYLEQFLNANGSKLSNWGPMAKAMIMAQCAHESDNFRTLTEYASGSAYEGRRDLGNNQQGDGVRYKGRGYIQLTGRANYAAAGRFIGKDLIGNPQQAATKEVAAQLVLWFFLKGNARFIGPNNKWNDIVAVTKAINGGTKGISDRRTKFAGYKKKYNVS